MIFSKFAEIDGKVEIEIPSDSCSNRRQSSCWKNIQKGIRTSISFVHIFMVICITYCCISG